jgi:hypothetical protein
MDEIRGKLARIAAPAVTFDTAYQPEIDGSASVNATK